MKAKTPVEALNEGIDKGGWPSMVSSRKFKKYQGRPGEIIEQLSPTTRASLRELKSDDISLEKVDRLAAWLGYDDDGKQSLKDLCFKFDKEILKI